MINPEDEIVTDLRTSCSKDEAVAKILGWMQGPIRHKYIKVTEHGIPVEQLPTMHSLDGTLKEHLEDIYEAARQALFKAAETNPSFENIEEKYEELSNCAELINTAASYLIDIDDEIVKGDLSEIRIDQTATRETGTTQLTLKSLDQWTRKSYGISVISPRKTDADIAISPEQVGLSGESDAASKGGLSRTKANNLITTLSLLVNAFALTAPKYMNNGKPNVKNIADHLAGLAAPQQLTGQKAEAIKDRIEEALKRKV